MTQGATSWHACTRLYARLARMEWRQELQADMLARVHMHALPAWKDT